MKVYIETYGCAANKSDSEIMLGMLKKAGFEEVGSPSEADVIILNTCIVKTPTANRMIWRIKKLKEYKKPLVVAGCMPKAERKLVERLAPDASLIGPNSVGEIVKVVTSAIKGKKTVALNGISEKPLLPHVMMNPIVSIVQISTGCLLNCSYCETKLARGNLHSFKPEDILKRVRGDLLSGSKEIWLTSQDNGCYGFDIGTDLPSLLEKIVEFEETFFLRVGMMNPIWVKKILSKLLKVYESEKIFKFFHLPVQSGSDSVLMHMKRGYTSEDFVREVETIRKKLPMVTITTDIIVGYPTESEEDFRKTVELIEATRPDVINISRFSPRPGTEAYKLKRLPEREVKERSRILHKLKRKIAEENNAKWKNWEGFVLVDENKNVGRNVCYKPVVVKSDKNLFGKIVKVRIVAAKSNFLIGKLIRIEKD